MLYDIEREREKKMIETPVPGGNRNKDGKGSSKAASKTDSLLRKKEREAN